MEYTYCLTSKWEHPFKSKGETMDYKDLRKRYLLYFRGTLILTTLLFLSSSMISHSPLQIACMLVLLLAFLFSMRWINNWYESQARELLYVQLDLKSWKQYVHFSKQIKSTRLQMNAKPRVVAYFYMIGDFESVIGEATEALSNKKLKESHRGILESYLIRSHILANPDMGREELDALLAGLTASDPQLTEKTKKGSVAVYDLTIAQKSNDYFEELKNEFKHPQLETIYYRALNAAIKGERAQARELFSQLLTEDEALYVVRMARECLDKESA